MKASPNADRRNSSLEERQPVERRLVSKLARSLKKKGPKIIKTFRDTIDFFDVIWKYAKKNIRLVFICFTFNKTTRRGQALEKVTLLSIDFPRFCGSALSQVPALCRADLQVSIQLSLASEMIQTNAQQIFLILTLSRYA